MLSAGHIESFTCLAGRNAGDEVPVRLTERHLPSALAGD